MTYICLEVFLVKLVKDCPGLSRTVPPHFCLHRKTLSYNLIRAGRFDAVNFTGPRLSPTVRSLFAVYSAKVWRLSGLLWGGGSWGRPGWTRRRHDDQSTKQIRIGVNVITLLWDTGCLFRGSPMHRGRARGVTMTPRGGLDRGGMGTGGRRRARSGWTRRMCAESRTGHGLRRGCTRHRRGQGHRRPHRATRRRHLH